MRFILFFAVCLSACGNLDSIGKPPNFNTDVTDAPHQALTRQPPHIEAHATGGGGGQPPRISSSLWTASKASLLGDRRAGGAGDILTVVIDINDRAKISNSSGRKRAGAENLDVSGFFGLPQRATLPEGASLADAVDLSSNSTFSGSGSVARNEQVTLRVAATVVEELPNNVLRIEGRQEMRINFEMRELIVSGYVRPADISRQNEITYDKIAEARISYGGRGQISDVQQPRYGQQITDLILPF